MPDSIEAIRAAFDRERRSASPPRAAGDLPLSYEAITDEWLTAILCRDHPGAAVLSHRLGVPDEGNTSRRWLFVEYDGPGRAAQLPATLFCKATHTFGSRISVGLSGGVHAEATFYNRVRPLLEIEAPRAVWANYDPDTLNSIIMLHPLAPGTEFFTLATDMTNERLHVQMALLAKVHGRFHRESSAHPALAELATWPEFFQATLRLDLKTLCGNGFRAGREVIPPRLFAREPDIWPATLASVEAHERLPQTLTHQDVHLRNWYIAESGAVGLSDWQGASRGHWGRDVAYTLASAMSVERRRRLERPLLEYYLDRLHEAGGPRVSFDEAWRHYRQQLPAALAWWTVTLAPSADMPDMQPRDATIEMVKRIAHAIDDSDALDSFA